MTVNKVLLILGMLILATLGVSVVHKDMVIKQCRERITVGSKLSEHLDLLPTPISKHSEYHRGSRSFGSNQPVEIYEYELDYFLSEIFGTAYFLVHFEESSKKVLSVEFNDEIYTPMLVMG